jgi:hypothetical protein
MNITEAAGMVGRREEFKCGHVRASRDKIGPWDTGQMSEENSELILADRSAKDLYVVYSYATPIAWFARGVWNVPDAGYSQTTKKQKTRLKLYALTPQVKSGN